MRRIQETLQSGRLADELELFIEGTTDRALFLVDTDGRITSWTKGAELLTGWTRDEIVGRSVELLYTEQDRAAGVPAADLDAVLKASPYRCEEWRMRMDGSEFMADVMLVALRNSEGKLHGFGQSIVDITSRKAAEHALRESEMLFRSILATIPDAMIVIDEHGVILSFSAAAERLFGYREAEMAGQNVSRLMPSPDRERHDEYIAHYLRTGERRIIGIGRVVTGQRRDGSCFPMELSVGEADVDGQRIFTGFIRDLTAQRLSEMRMSELQAELIHVSRLSAMGTMASTLAHELNQPLTAVTNYLEAGRDMLAGRAADELDGLLHEAIDEASKEALRAGQIVRRLREFVTRRETERRVEDLAILVAEAARLGLLGASERGIRLLTDLSPAAALVLVDRIQIQQVLVNLFRNAAEAVTGCSRRDISVVTRREDDMVRVSVADTGRGLDPAIAARLFEAFTSTKSDGMGLGLSICRTIVEAHGGRIWAESNMDSGSVFHFTIPIGLAGGDDE